jgi:hypothetical protein
VTDTTSRLQFGHGYDAADDSGGSLGLANADLGIAELQSEGTPGDLPAGNTVCGLGSHKDELVKAAISATGPPSLFS